MWSKLLKEQERFVGKYLIVSNNRETYQDIFRYCQAL